MRTNIDIDDELLAKAMACTGIKVKKALVEAGLAKLIRIHSQSCIERLRGTIHWEGNLDDLRSSERRPIEVAETSAKGSAATGSKPKGKSSKQKLGKTLRKKAA